MTAAVRPTQKSTFQLRRKYHKCGASLKTKMATNKAILLTKQQIIRNNIVYYK